MSVIDPRQVNNANRPPANAAMVHAAAEDVRFIRRTQLALEIVKIQPNGYDDTVDEEVYDAANAVLLEALIGAKPSDPAGNAGE
jgi:hypothetical protein